MIKKHFIFLTIIILTCAFALTSAYGQRKTAKPKLGKICGNPQIKCRTGDADFQTHEIPFEIPKGAVIYESEPFYAIILKTVKLNSNTSCENAISEKDRLKIQELFRDNKVFALKCSDAGDLYYTNVANNVNFIAVYAGKTLSEASNFLRAVKSNRQFKGANVRKMQAYINGT